MANLTLHCGAHHVEREQIDLVHTPAPEGDWYPIPHNLLLETVRDSLLGSGLRVVNEAHALTRDGARYFGLLELDGGADYTTVVGLRNSHDKAYAAGLVVGSCVYVCDNLSFSGEIKLARRHTRFIERDLPQLTHAAIGRLGLLRHRQDERIAAYKQHELDNVQADHLILELLRAQVITATKIPHVIREWEAPRHPEFAADGLTAWRLFNAVTENTKGGLGNAPRRGQALHGVLDAACGLSFQGLLESLQDTEVTDYEVVEREVA